MNFVRTFSSKVSFLSSTNASAVLRVLPRHRPGPLGRTLAASSQFDAQSITFKPYAAAAMTKFAVVPTEAGAGHKAVTGESAGLEFAEKVGINESTRAEREDKTFVDVPLSIPDRLLNGLEKNTTWPVVASVIALIGLIYCLISGSEKRLIDSMKAIKDESSAKYDKLDTKIETLYTKIHSKLEMGNTKTDSKIDELSTEVHTMNRHIGFILGMQQFNGKSQTASHRQKKDSQQEKDS